ncbi:uncharacterized protein LOC111076065 [Drosophila obscura]|uniref:uncharacterized protein LOC111076065 n=1 Tax=Drosophila obscura TaxID=7282 RepID=UPI001BB20ADD|nr:uncharacterized protein LOC111076065 [Drosophila obscura]
MFNKTILVALILCACYLSASQARPQLDILGPAVGGATQGIAQGATGGLVSKPGELIGSLTKTATGGGGSGLPLPDISHLSG